MNKKKVIALVLGAMLTAGIAFNFATTASYKQDLGTATQSLTAGSFSVQMGKQGDWEHEIFPGDIISEDTITLTNKNQYAVKFTVNLATKGIDLLDKALTLDLLNGDKSMGMKRPDGTVDIVVKPGEDIALTSHVTWEPKDDATDLAFAGQSVQYNYNVVAEAMPQVNTIVKVNSTDTFKDALAKAENGTAILLEAGNYDMGQITIGKAISIIGSSSKDTVINGKIVASNAAIENIYVSNVTLNSNNQHIALWQNTDVKSVKLDNVVFNHNLSYNQASMYFWGTDSENGAGYDLISITNCTFNYPNAGTGSDLADVNGQKVDKAFVGQTWNAKEVIFNNNTIKTNGTSIRKGFELSGTVGKFTAENNSFENSRWPLMIWLFEGSKDSEFKLNGNNFTDNTTPGITIEAYTGNVLDTLNAEGNSEEVSIINGEYDKVIINNGNMKGEYPKQ